MTSKQATYSRMSTCQHDHIMRERQEEPFIVDKRWWEEKQGSILGVSTYPHIKPQIQVDAEKINTSAVNAITNK